MEMQKNDFCSFFPSNVRKIGVISPSKLPDREVVEDALHLFKSWGIDAVCSEHCFTAGNETYFSSDELSRSADFNAMLRDESIDLIYCARGGYGAGYILDHIDWDLLRSRNLPVLGYSDITAFHLAMVAKNAGRPVAIKMIQEVRRALADKTTADCMRHTLFRLFKEQVAPMSVPIVPLNADVTTEITGNVMPENLMVMTSLCGSRYWPDWTDKIFVPEDIDEEPRKIDRALLQLDLCGVFDQVRAVVFGNFSGECGTDEEKLRVFRRFADRHPKTPFFYGLNFGHTIPSLSFVVNSTVRICEGFLTF